MIGRILGLLRPQSFNAVVRKTEVRPQKVQTTLHSMHVYNTQVKLSATAQPDATCK